MRLTRRHAIFFGIIPAVCFFILLNLPKLKVEEVPLRNGGHKNPSLKLESVEDLVNRPETDKAVSLEPQNLIVGDVGFLDQNRRATLGFKFSGAKNGHQTTLILAETQDGQYLETLTLEPKNGHLTGLSCLSVRPGEDFFLVARENGDEVGRWKIHGLTPSYDNAAEKDKQVPEPAGIYASPSPGKPNDVEMSLEQIDKKVADGFTRTYRVHYLRLSKDPTQTLDKMSVANDFFGGYSTSMVGNSGICVPASYFDRAHFISVLGNTVTLPGKPKPIHFRTTGPRSWEADVAGGKVRIGPEPGGNGGLGYTYSDIQLPQLITYHSQPLADLNSKSGAVYANIPESDFDATWFDQSGNTLRSYQTFRVVLDASKPDKVTQAEPVTNWSGAWYQVQVRMFSN